MKKVAILTIITAALAFVSAAAQAPKVGVVNFKVCVEQSKLGKQEQARFQELGKQMQQAIEAKEKEVNALAPKFSEEYMDTLTPEAEKELKAQFSKINQELGALESQRYTMLNQANYQIVQSLNEGVAKAAEMVAQGKGLDLVLNLDACFYHAKALDISDDVIVEMNKAYDLSQNQPSK